MATLTTIRGLVRDELGELTAGRWSDAQLNSWLNRGVDYLVGEFHRNHCWPLLRDLTKYTTYTLSTSYDEYTVWDVINNSMVSSPESSTNTYYGFVHGMIGDYILHQATLQEYHRLNATTGEYGPTQYEPWIMFSGQDRATKYLSFTVGSVEPVQDGQLTGATSAATARISIKHPVESGTFASSDATGDFYIYGDSGTFVAAEPLNYQAPKSAVGMTGIATISAAAVASVHDCPTFIIKPTQTSATTLHFWWLVKPTVMSAATDYPDVPYDCDELLILYTAARAWKSEGRAEMHAAFQQEFMQELAKKIEDYRQVTFQ